MQKLLITFIIMSGLVMTGQSQKTYQLNTKKSAIKWIGKYSFLFSEHTGTVQFTGGELQTSDGNITGGNFLIDMTTITNEEYEKGLGPVEHLRNEDFFDVNKFPEAKLVITSVEFFPNENRHRMFGNLTIKGITKPVEFWPEVYPEEEKMYVQLKIDRTRWGITHDNKVKEHAISDAIELYVTLQF
ncbi:MAG TPA: YceI family protein [Flavobacteriaceae bacterium]|nr:lipid-binding protein [Flavobacteriaceae bacterium]HBR54915.1 YceI family protein [Flavobacteriaceae bacterium]